MQVCGWVQVGSKAIRLARREQGAAIMAARVAPRWHQGDGASLVGSCWIMPRTSVATKNMDQEGSWVSLQFSADVLVAPTLCELGSKTDPENNREEIGSVQITWECDT